MLCEIHDPTRLRFCNAWIKKREVHVKNARNLKIKLNPRVRNIIWPVPEWVYQKSVEDRKRFHHEDLSENLDPYHHSTA